MKLVLTLDTHHSPRVAVEKAIAGLVASDLAEGYDIALHVGQAPGRSRLDLEAVALNLGREPAQRFAEPLAPGLPLAYRSALPLERWAARLVAEGVEGFLVPRADAHQGEYVARRDERLQWLTGFTGSVASSLRC
jgi:pyrrolidone-carboxylate peptidase